MSKRNKILIPLALVIVVGIFIFKHYSKNTLPNGTGVDTQNPNVDAAQVCYIWNTEAGDKAQLSMDIRDNKVTGEFNWLPAEKDKKVGMFEGDVSVKKGEASQTVHALWNTQAEGMMAVEELNIIYGAGVAAVGFGEMKDNGKGVYIYAHPDEISYAPNLSQTDCGDNAMD
jgi:hypothetical protein